MSVGRAAITGAGTERFADVAFSKAGRDSRLECQREKESDKTARQRQK
jgi:hypothetical protein